MEQRQRERGVLPAYAGMILLVNGAPPVDGGAPRIRGDDPIDDIGDLISAECSPHTRG